VSSSAPVLDLCRYTQQHGHGPASTADGGRLWLWKPHEGAASPNAALHATESSEIARGCRSCLNLLARSANVSEVPWVLELLERAASSRSARLSRVLGTAGAARAYRLLPISALPSPRGRRDHERLQLVPRLASPTLSNLSLECSRPLLTSMRRVTPDRRLSSTTAGFNGLPPVGPGGVFHAALASLESGSLASTIRSSGCPPAARRVAIQSASCSDRELARAVVPDVVSSQYPTSIKQTISTSKLSVGRRLKR